jgi:hypothetical protein
MEYIESMILNSIDIVGAYENISDANKDDLSDSDLSDSELIDSDSKDSDSKDSYLRKYDSKDSTILSEYREAIKNLSGKYPYDIIEHFEDLTGPVIETVDQIPQRLKYVEGSKIKVFSDHIGQRKLFLNELQFLSKVKSEYCIYAGSAPGHKTYYLSTLFPHIKFILIDPNKFELRINGRSHRDFKHKDVAHYKSGYPHKANTTKNFNYRITIIEDFMSDEYAEQFKQLDCCFISDIRSNVFQHEYPTDFDIYWNYSMMFNWITILQPELSMLKFRIPYYNTKFGFNKEPAFETSKKYGIDFVQDYKDHILRLPKAKLYIQPWAPITSTEVRAVIKKKDLSNIHEYDITEIEEKMCYYNVVDRSWKFKPNNNASKKHKFCHCNDCALENKILTEAKMDVLSTVEKLGIITNRKLSDVHSYPIFEVFDKQKMIERVNNYKGLTIKRKHQKQKGNKGKSGGNETDNFGESEETQSELVTTASIVLLEEDDPLVVNKGSEYVANGTELVVSTGDDIYSRPVIEKSIKDETPNGGETPTEELVVSFEGVEKSAKGGNDSIKLISSNDSIKLISSNDLSNIFKKYFDEWV